MYVSCLWVCFYIYYILLQQCAILIMYDFSKYLFLYLYVYNIMNLLYLLLYIKEKINIKITFKYYIFFSK